MPKKTMDEKIDELALMVGRGLNELRQDVNKRFDAVDQRLTAVEGRLDSIDQRLERVEFLIAGQKRRIEIVEDRVKRLPRYR